ncbi:MAG: hypothetical protein D6805_09835, partial [Planctomycetota bacterium]
MGIKNWTLLSFITLLYLPPLHADKIILSTGEEIWGKIQWKSSYLKIQIRKNGKIQTKKIKYSKILAIEQSP